MISYRLPGGKQKRAPVKGKDLNPYSIEDARKMHSKRVVQKAENKILDIKPDTKMTFNEMAEWYLSLEKVKALKSYEIEGNNIRKFNEDFGNRIVGTIKPAELENYQAQKIAEGVAEATIDHKIGVARRMFKKAFLNDLVGGGGHAHKAFTCVPKLCKGHSNARDRILSLDEFRALMTHLPRHTKASSPRGSSPA